MLKNLICITLAILLVGCGSRIDSMARTIEYAILGEEDVSLTSEQIDALAYPHQYLTIGEQPRIALALGFDDQGIYKWLSGAQQVLTTFNGRIVNMQGLTGGLVYIDNLQHDPLRCLVKQAESCALSWNTAAQFGKGHNASLVNVNGTFVRIGTSQLKLPAGTTLQVEQWQETMTSKDNEWVNNFWISTENRRVVKSTQQWPKYQAAFKMEELKAYGKDLTDIEATSE